MPTDFETAYAKINLALHVRKRRDDGYHEIETLFAFAEDGDRLSVEAADALSLTIAGRFADGLSAGSDNLIIRAAAILAERNGISAGARFHLEKRLPVAAGIGGGSADAAAALRLATRLWNIDLDSTRPSDVAAELGADVPACIISQTCFGTGVGDQLHRIDGNELAGLPLLLVNPLIACPTGPVFQAWNGFDLGPLDPESWVAGRNDLELPAITLHPEIADVLACLREMQPRIARMSGSGATCFAIFESSSRRDAALRQISTACPDWWTMASSIR
ncbi:MAG: 4-(cytidine 5'-diphospho)-2-C-methyl-D-erythritol kinase [Sphingomonadales bacterium]|jgi:4-diphosphocytidyl-2-C-methyl-D-erythritol kinase|uniref:4-(cytidine 5'-diphospho)-2-C-methyl-D-erythritol kinase n=2 Tax=Sphingorhabdus sp. TaxID=1902408 RepID=UPI003BB1D15A|nr:4-(cytidine 5'-diphospho)-2-C-methyl-D-erythritol kinase [Sphingomonadales bacterium]MBK9431805.1 4-(cytidine 5'-diphospho)-2-C-methyl-D-erythritol kinase [Sphingomonadales bacterium]MBL0022913.1 4-(cytidine 5'-diphospho)-2-C-methyl-D-erythritol kinase [Sphingomonadales bacterium]